MRVLVLLAAAVLLAACGSAPYAAPGAGLTAAPPSPPATAAASPTHATTTATDAATRAPVLLPRPCTPADGVRIQRTTTEGATGETLVDVELRSARPCTLAGPVRVRLLDASGRPMGFRFGHRPWLPLHERPMAVDPRHGAHVTLSDYRCDVTPDPPVSRTAILTLPGVARLRTRVRFSYCPQDPGNQPAQRSGIGSPDRGAAYAARIGSAYARGDDDTWARADVDGDGRPDVVLVHPSERRARSYVEVRLATGRTLSTPLTVGEPARLQGITQLDGRGGGEILVAATAAGADGGYAFVDTQTTAYLLEGGRPRPLDHPLTFDLGRGDLYAGITCHGDRVTEVSTETATDAASHLVRRFTWRIDGTHATRVSSTTERERGDPTVLTATHCPGLGANGWAE